MNNYMAICLVYLLWSGFTPHEIHRSLLLSSGGAIIQSSLLDATAWRRGWHRPTLSYLKLLENDMGMMAVEILSAMKDRDLWQQCVSKRIKWRLDKWWWWWWKLPFPHNIKIVQLFIKRPLHLSKVKIIEISPFRTTMYSQIENHKKLVLWRHHNFPKWKIVQNKSYKTITCCQNEKWKKITAFKTTFPLWDENYPNNSLKDHHIYQK